MSPNRACLFPLSHNSKLYIAMIIKKNQMPYGCLSGIGVGGSLFILQFPLLPPQPLAPLQLPFGPP